MFTIDMCSNLIPEPDSVIFKSMRYLSLSLSLSLRVGLHMYVYVYVCVFLRSLTPHI